MPTITSESRAKIRTSKGDLLLQFLPDKAPRTVENFVSLAKKGFYDGLTFHRILKDFVVQGGCPNGDGSGGPGYTIRPEFNDTPHAKGVVSMARNNDPHSAGSQFFICTVPVPYLDSRFTAFARVVEGDDVLDKIANVKVHDGNRWKERSTPLEPVYINGIDLIGVAFEAEPTAARAESADDDDDDDGDHEDGDGDEGEDGDEPRAVEEREAPAADAKGPAPARKGRGPRGAKPSSTEQADLFAEAAPAAGQPAEQAPASEQADEKPRRPRRKAARTKKAKDEE